MTTASFSPRVWGAFESVFRPWMAGRIQVRMAGLPTGLPHDRPLLVCANHVSWWDGFLIRELQKRLRPGAPLFTVMLQQELDKRWFFRPMGGLGLTPGSLRSVRELIRTLKEVRETMPNAVVSFFPQGRIWPSFRRPLQFEPGLRLITATLEPCTVLPVGLHIEPGNQVKPTAFIAAASTVRGQPEGLTQLVEQRVTGALDQTLNFLGAYGEHAADLWPSESQDLPEVDGHFPHSQPSWHQEFQA